MRIEDSISEASTVTQPTLVLSQDIGCKLLRVARLKVVRGTDQGRSVLIKKERLTIGRSAGCDLALSDSAISGLHAELKAITDGYVLRDLGSRNGIFFAGHRVGEIYLKPGTQFQLGNDLLILEPIGEHVAIPFSPRHSFGEMLGVSIAMREMFAQVEKMAHSDLPILLQGETGTGKGMLAREIHRDSPRRAEPFITLDCGSVPPELFESTIFGHEKGAFSGADWARAGVFEEAGRGTLFLDEVSELPLSLQPKLLRAIENKEIRRLGGVRNLKLQARIVAATQRDLWELVEEGSFRQDLLFRLAVVTIRIPPLRERPDDIAFLTRRFISYCNESRHRAGRPGISLGEEQIALLQSYPWPGNVRELKNVIERLDVLAAGEEITLRELQRCLFSRGGEKIVHVRHGCAYKKAKQSLLADFHRAYLEQLLEECGGNISRAARRAGLMRHHLRALCHRHGVRYSTSPKDTPGSRSE